MRQKKRKLFFAGNTQRLFLIPFFCIFFSLTVQAAEQKRLVPVGKTVGITLDAEGFLVLGTGVVDGEKGAEVAERNGLRVGDRILQVNGEMPENKEAFRAAVERCGGQTIKLLLERDGMQRQVEVMPIFSDTEQVYKLGIWIRDSIQGIGTVTCYDPESGTFGALGHGVYDVDTGELMKIRTGSLTKAELTEIVRGRKGTAGELSGKAELEEKVAVVEENTEYGVFGFSEGEEFSGEALPIAGMDEVKEGEAVILSDLEDGTVRAYDIQIEGIRKHGGLTHRDMTIRVTDERLLELTGGIVQGMSGSPVIQNGKLVGAVTHVLVNDPTRGYAIFIENMLETANQVADEQAKKDAS